MISLKILKIVWSSTQLIQEYQVMFKFCLKLEDNVKETFIKFAQAYRDQVLFQTKAF